MSRKLVVSLLAAILAAWTTPAEAQITAGSISGQVSDEQKGALAGASVVVRHVETNTSRTTATDTEGRFRVPSLPPGRYEVAVELAGFARHLRTGVTLSLNQDAVVDVTMTTATLEETVTVTADAPLINTTNPEVGVVFDTKRVSELPLGTTRNIYDLAKSAPGVAELGSGQSTFTTGVQYSANGMRTRSNNFMIDGQDSNDPSITGAQQPINNPDVVQEVRLITNQYAAEFGRAAGSVMNVVTKSGTNRLHGSAFWFYNGCADNPSGGSEPLGICLNARNNLQEAAGIEAPFRRTHQYGATLGGPVFRNKTFFFGAFQRWTDDQLGAGFTLNGAPTAEGRNVLQSAVGHLPQIQALLRFLPAGAPIGKNATFTYQGRTYTVPLGSLTGSAMQEFRNNQGMFRLDHHFSADHILNARYLANDEGSAGAGQVTPPGLTTVNDAKQQAANVWLTSILSNSAVNEFRVAWQRLNTITSASDPESETIPSIEISELGLTGFNAGANRTAIGLAVNLPQFRNNDTYQFQNTFSLTRGNHIWKVGVDVRHIQVESFFFPTVRGLLRYSTLQRYVDGVADAANINRSLPGGEEIQNYEWTDFFVFLQDEWRVADSLTLSLGVRYETPGNSIASLYPVNDRIVQAASGNQEYALLPKPKRDTDNIQPRVGFNWNPRTGSDGLLGLITGGDKLVVRGGYARTHDYAFININLNIASAFPFVAAVSLPTVSLPGGGVGVPDAFTRLATVQPSGLNPRLLTRTIVSEDFRSPLADQFSLDFQRQIGQTWVFRTGYVGTRGSDLFQTLDGNPRQPFSTTRVDPTRGVIRERSNSASSTYHSWQNSLEKRLSKGVSLGVHYTWSRFIDDASEIFNPSGGEVAVAQDSFNRAADRGFSSYDRTHRLAGNIVYELPVLRDQRGLLGKLFGGWQLNASFTVQSGAPFTVLNGADPTGALSGIDSLVGSAIRPNLNTNLDLSKMSIQEILDAGGARLFRQLCGNPSPTCPGERVGNVGRNTLRADGIENLDLGFIKNTRIGGDHRLQLWVQLFNALNHRNFGIPESRVNSANFLNEKGTNGGNRRIMLAMRYIF